jgi:hypothetical protein
MACLKSDEIFHNIVFFYFLVASVLLSLTSVTRFSTSGFFHQTILSGPLIHGLNPFRIRLRIREVIWQSRCLSGVNETAKAAWTVSMTLLRQPLRIQLCKLDSKSRGRSGVNDTAEAIWLHWFRGPRIREALAAFKRNINKKNYIVMYFAMTITITQKYRGYLMIVLGLSSIIDTTEAKIGDFEVEYLRQFQSICNKALTHVWGV